ncbi:MAG: type II secretion system protein GspJ [Fimbriimonadales bacterium]
MRRRGLTLLELLTALAIAGIVAISLSAMFSVAALQDVRGNAADQALQQRRGFEEAIRSRLLQAYVSEDAADDNTYFIGRATDSNGSLGEASQSDSIVFTIAGGRTPGRAFSNTEEDFSERNRQLGPVGGVTEVSLSMNAVGDAADHTGIFLREQTPSDQDYDQGGYERALNEDVEAIGFEFFDGTTWTGTWDTTTGERRLPAAVRVSYQLRDDENTYLFVVKLPCSDVNNQNPLNSATAGGQP